MLGRYGEKKCREIFTKVGECTDNKAGDINQWKKFDFTLLTSDGFTATFEIKYDSMCTLTGNIAIETNNPNTGLPSGLGCTEADFWLVVLNKGLIFVTPTSRLRKFVKDNEPHKKVTGGDNNNSVMLLYKKDVLLPAIFTQINEATPENLLKILVEMKEIDVLEQGTNAD